MDTYKLCDRLDYAGCNGVPAHCIAFTNGNVVVVKEVADNTGMSVTNAIEVIAATVCSKYGIAPEALELYEYYLVGGKKSLSQVYFNPERGNFRDPKWAEADIDDFEARNFPLACLGLEDSYFRDR